MEGAHPRRASRFLLGVAILIVAVYFAFATYVLMSGIWGSLATDFLLSQGAVVAFSAGGLLLLWFLWRSPRGRDMFPDTRAPSRRMWWAGTGYLVLAAVIVATQVGLGLYWWSVGLNDARGWVSNVAASVYMALFLVGVAVMMRAMGRPTPHPSA